MRILVTGGAGFIGSHTAIELLNKGYEVILVDNLSNSSIEIIDKIEEIAERNVTFYQIDLLNNKELEKVFSNHQIHAVIHFAGYKSVTESVVNPIKYYENNILSTINLCKTMQLFGIYNLIFSSSATVYGNAEKLPLTEETATEPINPYGRTKLMCEEILKDIANSDENWKIAILRYFNPVGAHPSGKIGEKPNGVPNNLMPYIAQVATRKRDILNVYGDDYPTKDGTGIRDYIHVVDLALGHIAALENLEKLNQIEIFNLGTGRGYSVLEVINTFEKVNGVTIPYKIVDRRKGDIAISFADTTKANSKLCWKARRDLEDMCIDVWRWESSQLQKS